MENLRFRTGLIIGFSIILIFSFCIGFLAIHQMKSSIIIIIIIVFIISALIVLSITVRKLNNVYKKLSESEKKQNQIIGSFIKEIYKLREAEFSLKKNRNYLQTIISSLSDFIFVFNEKGIFTDYNKTYKKESLYIPPEVFSGKHYKEILPDNISVRMKKLKKKRL